MPGDSRTETYGVWSRDAAYEFADPVARTSRLRQGWSDAGFIAANSPEKVLARIAAVRAVVAAHIAATLGRPSCWPRDADWPCWVIRELANAWCPTWRD